MCKKVHLVLICKVEEWGKFPVLFYVTKLIQSFNNISDIIFFLTYVLMLSLVIAYYAIITKISYDKYYFPYFYK